MDSTRRHALRHVASVLALSGALLAISLQVNAQDWPARPVKLLVGTAAGSAPDIIARLLAERLTQAWGVGVVVDNRPGAGGNVAARAAARSQPDGYTLWFAHATPVVMSQYLFKDPGFDPMRDFLPVVRVGVNPMMIAVHPAVPANDLNELVALGKSRAGKMSFSTSGSKNIPHLLGESLNQMTGASLLHIPYKGSQQAAQDTAGGLVEVYLDAIPPMVAWIGSPGVPGRLRPLAVFSERRVPGFEHVPTARESGVDLALQGWLGILAPSGTPAGVIEKVTRDVNAIVTTPDVVSRLRQFGTFEPGGTTAAFDALIRSDGPKWGDAVRAARVERE